MDWLVIYYNGHGNREKYFETKEEANNFRLSCGDLTATIWKLWIGN